MDYEKELKYLESLQEGWCDGVGYPIKPTIIEKVSNTLDNYPDSLPTPFIYPTLKGGVFLEWFVHKRHINKRPYPTYVMDISIEFNEGSIELYSFERDGTKEYLISDSLEEIQKKLVETVSNCKEYIC